MKRYITDTLLPCVGLSAVAGIGTGAVIVLYKFLAERILHLSGEVYARLQERLWLIPVAVAVLAGVAWLLAYIYKRHPALQGGGIPTAITSLRGVLRLSWWKNLIGTFVLSLVSFLLGVPLGNEGPAVLMGASIGRGAAHLNKKGGDAHRRHAITGGLCAGFSAATGAPLSGILFGLEETGQRLSIATVIASVTAVLSAHLTGRLLAPLAGVDTALFGYTPPAALPWTQWWIPLCVGVAVGLFAVVFLSYHRAIHHFFRKALRPVPQVYKIGAVLLLTLAAGLVSDGFVSTGHHLILSLFDGGYAVAGLVLLLIVRASLTLGANAGGITGGTFVPTLALGALCAAVLGKSLLAAGVAAEQYPLILALGLTACVAGMMKMPLTAVAFAVEALGCRHNLPAVVMVCAVAYAIPRLCGVRSLIETALEDQTDAAEEKRPAAVAE